MQEIQDMFSSSDLSTVKFILYLKTSVSASSEFQNLLNNVINHHFHSPKILCVFYNSIFSDEYPLIL